MESTTGLNYQLQEMAARIHELREIAGLSVDEMAQMLADLPYVKEELGKG